VSSATHSRQEGKFVDEKVLGHQKQLVLPAGENWFGIPRISRWNLCAGKIVGGGRSHLLCRQVANSFALAVTVAHYPTGASKWNPIERRFFSEVSRNWAGEPLDSYQKILNYARTAQTQTGLQVTAYLDRRFYPRGLKPTPDQIASLRLQPMKLCPSGTTPSIHNCKLVLAC
jgi:hypothetical protein